MTEKLTWGKATKAVQSEEFKRMQPDDKCYFCGKPPYVAKAIIFPVRSEYEGSEEHVKIIRYCLCKRCAKKGIGHHEVMGTIIG